MEISRVLELINSDVRKDLHIHSFYSDGKLSPEEILRRWSDEGYEVIAITDHDGIEGSLEAGRIVAQYPVELIPGIEFDSSDELSSEFHILGYGIDCDNEYLRRQLDRVSVWREERNAVMLEALRREGYEITDEDIYAVNEGRYVGKPTYAEALVRKGYVPTRDEVFRSIYRNNEAISNIGKTTLSSSEVIDTIHKAGGIAVMSHPMEQRRHGEPLEEYYPRLLVIMDRMREYGIDGIECRHPSASEEQAEMLLRYANEHKLLTTEGSDYHDNRVRDYTWYHK